MESDRAKAGADAMVGKFGGLDNLVSNAESRAVNSAIDFLYVEMRKTRFPRGVFCRIDRHTRHNT